MADEQTPDSAPDEAADAEDASSDAADDAAEVSAAAATMTAESEALLELLEAALGDAVIEHEGAYGDAVVRVRADAWRGAAEVARGSLDCDYLSFVSGLDWQPRVDERASESGEPPAPAQPEETTYGAAGSAGRFQVFARVSSTSKHWGITLKADLDENEPVIDSWVPVYPGADWHERECWEMYGFRFAGHPSLRNLYLPSGFEGYPLRKDYALLAREVKPWPGIVDVEDIPAELEEAAEAAVLEAGGGDE